MPNWSINTLIVTGEAHAVRELFALACGFDADELAELARATVTDPHTGAPVSEELLAEVASHLLAERLEQFSFNGHDPMPAALAESTLQRRDDDPERWDALQAAHGAGSWFYWCVQHWSTKWDARDVYVMTVGPELVRISFLTAWGPPTGWLATVAVRHPECEIQLACEVEGYTGYAVLTVDHEARAITETEITKENAEWFWLEVLGLDEVPADAVYDASELYDENDENEADDEALEDDSEGGSDDPAGRGSSPDASGTGTTPVSIAAF